MIAQIMKDHVWGFVLVIIGLLSIAFKPSDKITNWLTNQSDAILTTTLFILVVIIICIAIRGTPGAKALAVAWVVTP